jgi:hypothetical protein
MWLPSRYLVPAAAAGGALLFFLWPNEEKAVRRHLERLADTIEKQADEKDMEAAAKALKISNYFTPGAVIVVGKPVPDLSGRASIKQAALFGRASVQTITVDFVDVSVNFEEDGRAHVECTAQGRVQEVGSERGIEARYIEMILVKQDGEWLIDKMNEVKALQ